MHHSSVSSNLRLDTRTEDFFSLEIQVTPNKVPSNTLQEFRYLERQMLWGTFSYSVLKGQCSILYKMRHVGLLSHHALAIVWLAAQQTM